MRGWKRTAMVAVVIAVLLEQAWLLAPAAWRWAFPPHEDPAVAGRRVAERLGCFSCHGPEGKGGTANPGSENKNVIPALAGGEMMMWAENENELREWILYGHRLSEEQKFERHGYSAGQGSKRAIVMPAFEPYLRAGELDQLVAYLKAISGLQFPEDEKTAKGLSLAYELGCFRCHGPMGTGGRPNPDSLKGYVPGFGGKDYEEIVTSREELRQWLEHGISDRFRESLPARTIIDRQAVKMPAYGEHLEAEKIDALVTVVEWLASGQWRATKVP
jgi:mono/diheme cytochrome c family protein